MGRADHGGDRSSGPETVPPFWLCSEECQIDQRVETAARESWTWAFWLIRRQLNDGTRTAEIIEHVAADVSSRLKTDPDVGRNLSGYFRTAVILRVKTLAARERRVTYAGDIRDLEKNYRLNANDWTKVLEDRLTLQLLLPFMSHTMRHIMHYRQLDYSWRYISQRMALTEKQAKLRFYYGLRQAHQAWLEVQAKRARGEEPELWR